MSNPDLVDHLAFSIAHGTFNVDSPGGCSCTLCTELREKIKTLSAEEATKFYNEYIEDSKSITPITPRKERGKEIPISTSNEKHDLPW